MNRMKIDSMSNYLRGFAITGVVIENFLSWIPINTPVAAVHSTIRYVEFLGASLVHIFFFLSGYGLVKKYHDSEQFPWKKYAINRFSLIVVPYWIVVTGTYLFINSLHSLNPEIFEASYNLSDLMSYICFIRNFNRSAWGINPTLWFMQVIFGLYITFPFLLFLVKKHSLKTFLLTSALIAYWSRCLFLIFGHQMSRESSFFLFYIFEFSLGMAFAWIPDSRHIGIKIGETDIIYFIVAVAGYIISYILKEKFVFEGNIYDIFTCVGSVALGIFSYQALAYLKLGKLEKIFKSIGSVAFIIYLVHAPLIQHCMRPLLKDIYHNHQGLLSVFTLLLAYFILIVLISERLVKFFKALSIKIENNLGNRFGVERI